jgi:CHAT domain-containing protein
LTRIKRNQPAAPTPTENIDNSMINFFGLLRPLGLDLSSPQPAPGAAALSPPLCACIGRLMNFRFNIRQSLNLALCLLMLATAPRHTFAQSNIDPIQLQKTAIALIDHWLDHVRTTGDAASTRNELAIAQTALQASYVQFLQRQDAADAALSAIKLGDIQRYLNQWPAAISIYQNAVKLAAMSRRADYQTKALAELAFSELRVGSTDAATDHIREAVRLGADCGNKNFYFDALNTAGEIETKRGNLVASGELLNRALSLSDQLDDREQLYLGYSNRADIYFQKAQACDPRQSYDVCDQLLNLARADYQKAQSIAQERGYSYLVATSATFLQNVDTLKTSLQRTQNTNQNLAAMNMFNPKAAKDVLVTQDFTTGPMDAGNLALVENAVKELRDWLARMQQQGLVIQDLDPKDLSIQGSLLEMKGDDNAALAKHLQAVQLLEQDRRKLRDEQARSAFMEDKIAFYYSPALILLQQKRYPEAFALFEQSRSRAMADMLASRSLTLGTPQERTLFSELQSQRTTIAALQEELFNLTGGSERDQNGKQIADIEAQIPDLQKKYQALETRISREAPRLNQLTSSEPVTLESVQRAAGEGGYDILYYVVLDTNIVLWHINGTEVEVKKIFLPHPVLTGKVTALHDSLLARRDSPSATFDEDIARQLYLFLIQPVAPRVKSNHLLIVPQEELTSIPFQALLNPKDGKFLGESFNISYAPSATVLSTLKKRASLKDGRLLAIADPAIHDASEEINSIGALYPGRSKVTSQEPVTKEEVVAWAGNYNLVHLSVHGKFNASDPLLSYLQFRPATSDDGRLTAAEMFGLPLQKNSMVVLSACETGRVQATHSGELIGMVRALLYAGAGDLVLSSWEVNATSTKVWMETFYREGQTREPAEAARLALVAVKSQPEFSHPFFWAPFVVTGK